MDQRRVSQWCLTGAAGIEARFYIDYTMVWFIYGAIWDDHANGWLIYGAIWDDPANTKLRC